jgi:hypothetical protein
MESSDSRAPDIGTLDANSNPRDCVYGIKDTAQ